MARSVGVAISAVVVLIGCAFTGFFGALAMLGSLIGSTLNRVPNAPPHLGAIVFGEAIFAFGFAGWGIATGVGLLRTREWARISVVIFSVILLFFTLPPALLMAFIQFPVPNDPNLPSNFSAMMRVGMCSFFGILAALGGFWLYFFNTRSVKAQFQGREVRVEMRPAPLSGQTSVGSPSTPSLARPLSITIIGWYLLIAAGLYPFGLLYAHAMFSSVPLPMCFMGFFLFGRRATMILLVWMAAQIVAAVGLLKLKNWGRLATIALQSLGILNLVLLGAIPANRARFQNLLDSAMASMNPSAPRPFPFVFPAWAMMAASVPIFVVILGFLFTRKRAFISAEQQAVRLW
jgi:hypothetical protein